jgi:hypothetical protein
MHRPGICGSQQGAAARLLHLALPAEQQQQQQRQQQQLMVYDVGSDDD